MVRRVGEASDWSSVRQALTCRKIIKKVILTLGCLTSDLKTRRVNSKKVCPSFCVRRWNHPLRRSNEDCQREKWSQLEEGRIDINDDQARFRTAHVTGWAIVYENKRFLTFLLTSTLFLSSAQFFRRTTPCDGNYGNHYSTSAPASRDRCWVSGSDMEFLHCAVQLGCDCIDTVKHWDSWNAVLLGRETVRHFFNWQSILVFTGSSCEPVTTTVASGWWI